MSVLRELATTAGMLLVLCGVALVGCTLEGPETRQRYSGDA